MKLSSSVNPSADTYKLNSTITVCRSIRMLSAYLVSNLDEQSENDDDEQVVKDADSSDDDVDDFECEVTDVPQIQL